MASFVETASKPPRWQAIVRRTGYKKMSRVFESLDLAKEWAAEMELKVELDRVELAKQRTPERISA